MKKILLALLLAVMILLCGCEAADYRDSAEVVSPAEAELELQEETFTAKELIDPEQVDKAEVVYVTAGADGSTEKTEVSVTLKNPGGLDSIRDITNLTHIKNAEGNEEYTRSGDVLTWENHGADINYKGQSSQELPLTLKVTYYLDGEEISPEALAGKSGHVKLRFEYTNNTDYVPFICASIVMLDKENFSGIQGDGVRLLRYGDYVVAFGVAVPGIDGHLNFSALKELGDSLDDIQFKDSLEIEMDTTGFSLDYTETVVLNGVFSELEDSDLDELLEAADKLGEASSASDQLENGIDKLISGIRSYQSGINAYTEGVDQCADAAQQLNENMQKGIESIGELMELLPDEIRDAVNGMSQAVAGLSDGLKELSANSEGLRDGARSILSGCSALSDGVRTLNREALMKMVNMGSDIKDIISRVKTLRGSDSAYCNFSGIEDGKTGSVMFMIETAEIKP